MAKEKIRLRQVVDWSAAVWAGLIAGTIFLLLNIFLLPALVGGNMWVILRLFASLAMGDGVLAPPATFDMTILLVALVTHFALSLSFALLLAFLIHRWGLLAGILLGALFGLALYSINFFTLTLFFPWFYAFHSLPMMASHVVFGALAGGIYEGLEVEEFVAVES